MLKPVVLSGGKGSRLWPLSREFFPKPYLSVLGKNTLLQQTMERVLHLDHTISPMVICNREHRFLVAEQLRQINRKAEIVLEPFGRDTAPAIALGALLSLEEDPLLFVLPSDHIITNEKNLALSLDQAVSLAEEGYLVTFGIVPDGPETGYGYIRSGAPFKAGYQVEAFVEKPDEDTAKKYIDSGGYYWNSGMFVFRASVFLKELEKFAPAMVEACRKALEKRQPDLDFIRIDEESFLKCPAKSVDFAVMEKTDKCAMVALDAGWSDIGSWDALYGLGEKDEHGNVIMGDVVTRQTSNCYLHSEKRLLAVVGVDDIIAVDTSDAILVTRKDQAHQVKEIFNELMEKNRVEARNHRKIYRPWGTFESLILNGRFQVKRIIVNPGEVISLQKHFHRAEHWVVVSGTAKVTNGDNEFLLCEDQSTYIPLGSIHRLENPGRIPLEIIEVQTGAYLGEDDIVRLEDRYGR